MIPEPLLDDLRSRFHVDWHGIHGVRHWARVRNNGLRLAQATGAEVRVVELFSFLHDSCRRSEGHDPDHGPRAAEYARAINGRLIQLTGDDLTDLADACIHHTRGLTTGFNATVLTCWDADRLDLGRVGVFPDAKYLCTAAAKAGTMLEWAYRNSVGGGLADET